MENTAQEQIELIKPLVNICNDGFSGYAALANEVEDEELKTIFLRLSQQRKQFAEELNKELLVLGAEKVDSGTLKGELHQAWIKIKSLFTSNDEEALIEACLTAEYYAAKQYKDKLTDTKLSSNLRDIVEKHHMMIEGAHKQLSSLEKESA